MSGRKAPRPPMPALEALMAFVQAKPTDMLYYSVPRHVNQKKFFAGGWSCLYHFACYITIWRQDGELLATLHRTQDHRALEPALRALLQTEMIRFHWIINDPDGRYKRECVPCEKERQGAITKHHRRIYGEPA